MTSTEVLDLQSDVRHLEGNCQSLRTDVDSLLAVFEHQRRELAELRTYVKTLRDRIDQNELAGVA